MTLGLWTMLQGALTLPIEMAYAEDAQAERTGRVYAQAAGVSTAAGVEAASSLTTTEAIPLSPSITITELSASRALTAGVPLTAAISSVTTTASVTNTASITDSATTDPPDEIASDEGSADDASVVLGVVDGTILANRTSAEALFFVEGETHTLPPLRSMGLDLPRASTVLNLFNCDADAAEDEDGCFWDPYMIDRDGFYEIVAGEAVGRAASLLLQEVGGPEGADIWIQNRSAKPEVVVYRSEVYDLLPGAIREFSVGEDALPTFFLRSCVEVDDASACEWAPAVAQPGVYYVLREVETAGGLPNSRVTLLELDPVSSDDETADETPLAAKQILCNLLVPALNVRSGPGLEYEIVAKIRGTETAPASVLIIGRNETAEWLAVDERVAPGGWITGSDSFVTCDSSLLDLDEVAVTDGRLAPTPEPVAVEPAVDGPGNAPDDQSAGDDVAPDDQIPAETPTPVVEVPDGQSLLIINNGFDHDIRFTLDQKYRVQPGPSEYDLAPGGSVSIFVYPGMVGFSASTAWRGLSDNDDFFIEEEDSRTLWLIFVPDPDGSGRWLLQY